MKIFRRIIHVLTGQTFSLYQTLRFNFTYLPFPQAIKLPILVKLRPHYRLKGKLIIEGRVHYGMIILGIHHNKYYPKGLYFVNDGILILREGVYIGNESNIAINRGGVLDIGENVGISSSNITCANSIKIGKNTFLGNDCKVFDCDFHLIKDEISGDIMKPYSRVKIGENNWLGFECMVMKGAVTPNYCIASARTVIRMNNKFPERCIIGGDPVALIGEGYSKVEGKESYIYYPKWEKMVAEHEAKYK